MSDYSVLVAALAQFHTDADSGTGPPPRISDHEADRLAGMATGDAVQTEHRRRGTALLRRPFGRRPSFA
ncbi:hypothetical protein [Kitasatospora sp. NBC_00315]|uniref:hypothetical protein n=1 Tax=Kitasatospora sp. NBC_00315 TaxID=2975963 RepID=UPI0032443153